MTALGWPAMHQLLEDGPIDWVAIGFTWLYAYFGWQPLVGHRFSMHQLLEGGPYWLGGPTQLCSKPMTCKHCPGSNALQVINAWSTWQYWHSTASEQTQHCMQLFPRTSTLTLHKSLLWLQAVLYLCGRLMTIIWSYKVSLKTLPEAQRTQGIESITWIMFLT